ncbi:hypothetical protein [Sphingomonas sp. Leaf412]|uniref:hypothetical protein n=1 Tax=Sphingomonas sp. Leaf412 TaxID=1736370 RepID=UPI001910AFA0|nr:hypothetical protein [Sphingomonas sp. Leaf412]
MLFSSDTVRIATASKDRKDICARRLRYYWDEQSQDTLKLIARRWSRPEQFRVFSINMVRAITNRRANTYRIQPRRVFTGVDQATMDALYRSINADAVLKKASRYTKLCKTAVLQVGFNEAAGVPTLNVITPNVLDVLYSDPEHPERVIITHGATRAEDVTFSDWTATGYRRLNYRGAPRRIDGNPGNANPYGVLPFVPLFDRLPDDQFFLPGGDDLIEAQDAVNVALANLWRSVESQAHGQAWASGISANEILQFGPDRAIALPQGGTFGFASPNSPIASILSAIEFVMRQTAATHGVGSDVFDLSKVAESGSAKHAGRIELREERLDDIAQWRIGEARLFAVLKAVVNTHRPGTIPDDATIAVDFAELMDSLTESEQLANSREKIDLGLWSPADALMAINPDGYPDRTAAMRELQSRRDESAALALPL